MPNGAFTVLFRNTRCDYYNGGVLAGGPFDDFEALGDLAGYLWFTRNHNTGGYAIISGEGTIGNAAHFYELCHVTTVFGDFGLCDEITLYRTGFRIGILGGVVEISPPEQLRQVRGFCN